VQVGIDIGRDHQATLQVDFLVCLGQILADLFDDAFVDQDLAGFIVLSVDSGIGEFFHYFSFIEALAKPPAKLRLTACFAWRFVS
jgi:hypothetical protein